MSLKPLTVFLYVSILKITLRFLISILFFECVRVCVCETNEHWTQVVHFNDESAFSRTVFNSKTAGERWCVYKREWSVRVLFPASLKLSDEFYDWIWMSVWHHVASHRLFAAQMSCTISASDETRTSFHPQISECTMTWKHCVHPWRSRYKFSFVDW